MVDQSKEGMKQWNAKIAFASSPFGGSFWIFSFLADPMEDSFLWRIQALTWLAPSLQQLCILGLAPFLCSFEATIASWLVRLPGGSYSPTRCHPLMHLADSGLHIDAPLFSEVNFGSLPLSGVVPKGMA